ncbi:MAG: DUF4397 domain-containing protein [Actinomycetota bacterium]|nr:DUF4397 domain-containing protein [Actinomycetota bacterium]
MPGVVGRLALVVLGALAVVALAPLPAHAQANGHLRVAHLSPSTGAMDVYVSATDGGFEELLAADVTYGEVTGYESLPPGEYVFSWRRAGASPSGAARFRSSTVLPPGGALTVAALGAGGDVRSTLVVDDLSAPPSGTARLRLANADETAGSVRVAVDDRALFGDGAAFAVVTDYVEVPAGVVALDITTGDRPDGIRTDLDLAPGSVNTLVILQRGGGVSDLEAVVDAEGATVLDEARVLARVVDAAAAPEVPEVGAIATGAGGTAVHVGGSGLATPAAVLVASCLVAAGVLTAATRRSGDLRP